MEEGLEPTPITVNPRHEGMQILRGSKGGTVAARPEALTEMLQVLLRQCSQTVQQSRGTGQLECTLQRGGLRRKRRASKLLEGAGRGRATKATMYYHILFLCFSSFLLVREYMCLDFGDNELFVFALLNPA